MFSTQLFRFLITNCDKKMLSAILFSMQQFKKLKVHEKMQQQQNKRHLFLEQKIADKESNDRR